MSKSSQASAVLATLLLSVSLSLAQDAKAALAAPVPEQLITAKKVFVSNAGADGIALRSLRVWGDENLPYNLFYAKLKNLGRYEIVDSPNKADLVFEIRCLTLEPEFEVKIFEARTHFLLWSLGESIGGALRKSSVEKNLDRAMTALVGDLKALAAPATASTASNH